MIEDIKPRRRVSVMAATTAKPESINVSPEQQKKDTMEPSNQTTPETTPGTGTAPALPPAQKKYSFKKWFRRLKRRQLIIMAAALGLLISSGVVFALTRPEPPVPVPVPAPVVVKEEPPKPPDPILSKLTGIEVTKNEQALPVTSVMIENSPDARPQSGLLQAGVVFEAIAEGGITRFVSLYQESQPDYIGPVRSVRPYYLDFIVPFDAPLAHAGGSGQALAEIQQQNIKDLDYSSNPGAYERITSRFAPHNLYTSRAKLLEIHNQKGFTKSDFTGFPRKKDKPATASTTVKASRVDLNISSYNYNSFFTYDKASNSYLRSMAGIPHVDERSGKQINPKVVIVPIMPHGYAGIYSVYANAGKDRVYIFQDGTVQEGVWKKTGRTDQVKFYDTNDKQIKLNAGQTWITLASNPEQVVVTP